MTTLRQKLEAAKLEKYEREQTVQENIAARGRQIKNAFMALGLAALTAGCVTGLMKYDQTRTNEFEKELNAEYPAKQSTEINTPYAENTTSAISKKPRTRETFSQDKYQKSLDSLLEIRNDMSNDEIRQVVEIEMTREELMRATYETTFEELQNESQKDTSINKTDYLKGRFAKFKQYAPIIETEVTKYNAKFNFPKPLTVNHIYAMIEAETGNHPQAFKKDPMQVANQGDHALSALREGKEYTWQIGDFSFLNGKKHTKIAKWKKQYDKSNMDAESSIKAGIPWLINKAAIRNANGEITGWRNWEEAARRYNGGGDDQYKAKVQRNVYHLNALTKI